MAYSTISKAKSFFNTIQYSGTGSAATVTGVGFKPDLFWIKQRNSNQGHLVWDGIRGGNYYFPTASNAQSNADVGTFTAASDGYSLNTDPAYNGSGSTYVGYNWLMGGATPSQTYKVVVVSDSGNKYRFRNSADNATFGESAVTLDLQEGGTYTFDVSDSTMNSHPFVIGTAANSSEYSTGVTYKLDGVTKTYSQYTSGFSAATSRQLIITVPASAPALYYWCSQHSGMGGAINTNSTLGSTNFDGTKTSIVSANATSGCSLVKYTGTASNNSFGHGLSGKPDMIWMKPNGSGDWNIYHDFMSSQQRMKFNNNMAAATNASIFQSLPDTTKVTLGTSGDAQTDGAVGHLYCFKSVPGFSKMGHYTYNNSTDGNFIYCGFKPQFIMIKNTDNVEAWYLLDMVRKGNPHDNANDSFLTVSSNQNEDTVSASANNVFINITSTGFKIRTADKDSGELAFQSRGYLYMAFGQPLVGSNNVPATAL